MANHPFDARLASLGRRATAARVVLIAYCGIEVLLSLMLAVRLYGELTNTFFSFVSIGAGILGLVAFLLLLVCIVLVPLWTWRAHANLDALGLSGLIYSPGWATVAYFVPVANLFVPFLAMRELYNRSHGEHAHFAAISVDDANAWWTAWLVSALVGTFIAFTQALGPATGIHVVTAPAMLAGLNLFTNVLAAVAAFYLLRLIGAITRAQRSGSGVEETFA